MPEAASADATLSELAFIGAGLQLRSVSLSMIASGNALDAAATAIDSTSQELGQVHQALDDRRVLMDQHAKEIAALGDQFLQMKEPTGKSLHDLATNLHQVGQDAAAIDKTLRSIGDHMDIGVPRSVDWHFNITWAHRLLY